MLDNSDQNFLRKNYKKFKKAAEDGNNEALKKIWHSSSPQQGKLLLENNSYCALGRSAYFARQETLEMLCGWLSAEQQNSMFLIDAWNNPFILACYSGNINIVRTIWIIANTEQRNAILSAFYYGGFRGAAQEGYKDIVIQLWSWASIDQRKSMLTAFGYGAFVDTTGKGQLEILKLLLRLSSIDQRNEMLVFNSCRVFERAAKNQKFEVLDLLWRRASEQQRNLMLTCFDCYLFTDLVSDDNHKGLVKLWKWATPEQRKTMFQAKDYRPITYAVNKSKPETLHLILALADEEMLKSSFSQIFRGETIQSEYENASSELRTTVDKIRKEDINSVIRQILFLQNDGYVSKDPFNIICEYIECFDTIYEEQIYEEQIHIPQTIEPIHPIIYSIAIKTEAPKISSSTALSSAQSPSKPKVMIDTIINFFWSSKSDKTLRR